MNEGHTHVVKVSQGGFSAIVVIGQRVGNHHDVCLFDHGGAIHRSIFHRHAVLAKDQHVFCYLRPCFIRLHIELLAECIGVVQRFRDDSHRETAGIDVVCIFILADS